ncbi:MAG: DUF1080 domain-containing protein [Saprospiraceae bacterium]|nr:DUF1080 domain-containing protein [Saprospiraceae bacterium]
MSTIRNPHNLTTLSGSFLFIILALFSLCCENSSKEVKEAKDIADWEGNLDYFRLEGDAIVAGNLTKEIPNNEFLCTERTYQDFEITLKAKLIGQGKNAGIQFWSERIPDHHEVIGFQCDIGSMDSRPIWGSLYDESRRRSFLAHGEADSVRQVLHPNDWNDFTIRGEGNRIQIWLNGYQTVDYIELDTTIVNEGLICLQIHSGPPAEAWYKDVRIREL